MMNPTDKWLDVLVVVATGPFQRPYTPPMAHQLAADAVQLRSAQYRNPAQLPAGARVLVVGAANSGLQIAGELAASHRVTVAVGSRPPQLPQRLLGRDLFSWLDSTGLMSMPATSRLARRIRARGDVVIGTRTRTLRRRGVEFRPRLSATRQFSPTGSPRRTTRDPAAWRARDERRCHRRADSSTSHTRALGIAAGTRGYPS
jgi:cation diffusion facilitator CzcD-associated flavoprotein CzcO